MKRAIEQLASTATTPIASYDPTKWNLGTLISQDLGEGHIGPLKTGIARVGEEPFSSAMFLPSVISYTDNIDWMFVAENISSATATRRISMYDFNRTTSSFGWKGIITFTFPTATAHTIRDFRMTRYLHNTGTVAVSGTAVTGTSTLFSSDRIAVGARIGFNTTDPTQVTTWYYISAIGSDTSITLTASAGTISAGTAYVIEELRPVIFSTNATAANGGLFVAKGITPDDFKPASTVISASAASTDNLKLVYKLSDASTTTLTAACGADLDAEVSKTEHSIYLLDGTTNHRIAKINLRANNTITTGQMVLAGSNIVLTGIQTSSGAAPQTRNLCLATTNHSVGSGVKSLYFVSPTRLVRTAVSNITNGSTSWISDQRLEITPGMFGATSINAMQSLAYLSSIDRFLVLNVAGNPRQYITKYPVNSGDPFDYFVGNYSGNLLNAISGSLVIEPFNILLSTGTVLHAEEHNGIIYIGRSSTATATCPITTCTILADQEFAIANNQILISPSISLPNNNKLEKLCLNTVSFLTQAAQNIFTEPYKIYYRTSGISDNSGTWTLLSSNDLSGAGSAANIQFRFIFHVIGTTCIPSKIKSLTVTYEDLTTDSHYEPCADLSDVSNKRFAWKFSTAFGGTVPTLRIRLYNAITNGLLDDDDSVTQVGTWEKSTNGTSWAAYNTTDKANDTTFIRFTPASLADNIQVRALLTQL
jgi:hypothetical protein